MREAAPANERDRDRPKEDHDRNLRQAGTRAGEGFRSPDGDSIRRVADNVSVLCGEGVCLWVYKEELMAKAAVKDREVVAHLDKWRVLSRTVTGSVSTTTDVMPVGGVGLLVRVIREDSSKGTACQSMSYVPGAYHEDLDPTCRP